MPERGTAILTILILAAGVAGFFALFERYEESVDHGASADADRNPYLAAELFLRRVGGGPVESHASWTRMGELEEGSTLVIANTRLILSNSQVDELLRWVRAGGHLIVGAAAQSEDEEATDRLLQRFEVSNLPVTDDGEDEIRPISEILREWNADLAAGVDPSKSDEPTPPGEITHLVFEGDHQTLELTFSPDRVLHHPIFDEPGEGEEESEEGETVDADGSGPSEAADPEAIPPPKAWVGSDAGVHLLQFALGEGWLTIVSDAEIWTSSRIGEVDHAHLLWQLVNDGRIVILYGRNVIGVIEWLYQNALQPLLVLALTILAWLWYRGRRFGPLRGDPPVASRSLAEQIVAQAEYLWRTGHQHVLLHAMRGEIEKRARRAHPGYPRLSEAARLALLGRLTGIDESSLRRALLGGTPRDEQGFLDLARQLQQLRKAS